LVDRQVLDSSGDPLGISVAVYADGASGHPKWLAVYTGRRVVVTVMVPVDGSSLLGDDVIIAHDLDTVLASPVYPTAMLDPTHEVLLSAHYRSRACNRPHPSRRSDVRVRGARTSRGPDPYRIVHPARPSMSRFTRTSSPCMDEPSQVTKR
jgi:hypothetical protein